MAKTKISEYSSTANSNTDIASINIDEGCAPSGINNAIRALMAQIHDLYAGSSGDTWPVTAGGTGSGTASGARTNLGLAIGTDVQAYNAALAAIAANNGTNMMKNRIINGAMMIDQRNAGASVTPAHTDYTLDRWQAIAAQPSKFSVQQNSGSVTPPEGFTSYLGCTSLSSYSVGASEAFAVRQSIEGYNIADLGWGTSDAKAVTLSFWVRSSITGTFGGVLKASANARVYPYTYTINSANTWEQKTITIAGDTSGTWLTNNGIGIIVLFSLGAGSTVSGTAGAWGSTNYNSATGATSVVGTNGATFYITGVQLEKGSTATSFDYRPYGTELALCQRYCQKSTNRPLGIAQSGYGNVAAIQFPVTMRTAPTLTSVSYASPNGGTVGTVNAVTISADGFSQYNNSNNSSVNYEYTISYTAGAEL